MRAQRQFTIATFTALILFGCASNVPKPPADHLDAATRTKIDEIDAVVHRIVIDGKAAGVVWGIQVGHVPMVTHAYGLADLHGNRSVEVDDQFRIASITKTLVATSVFKLVQSGKLALEDPLSKFFPEYPNGAQITIYHLLSHTSGVPDWWDGKLPADTPNTFPMCAEPHRYLQRMEHASLFAPGEFYKYSNTGYVLLGEIIEKASHQSFESYLAASVLGPAHMTATEMEHIERPARNWVSGYVLADDKPHTFADPETYSMPFTAGGLRSTTGDLLKFVRTLMDGHIIAKKYVSQMTSYAHVNSGAGTSEAPFIAPGGSPPKAQENITARGYGLGWNLMNLYGKPAYYHSGGIAGFNSYVLHLPESDVTIVMLANTEDALVSSLKDVFRLASEIGQMPKHL